MPADTGNIHNLIAVENIVESSVIMQEIIKELYKDEEKFNSEAVEQARKNKGKINKYLLDELKEITKEFEKKEFELPLFIDYAIYLLAEFKETKACPLILDLISVPRERTTDCIGYGILDRLPDILASVYDGNIDKINKILENKKIDWYIRSRTLSFYQYLYENNMITKEEVVKYLRKLIKVEGYEYSEIHGVIVDVIANCHLLEMIEDVKLLFDYGVVELSQRGDFADFIDDIFTKNSPFEETIKPVDSVEKYMSFWYDFGNEEKPKDLAETFSKVIEKEKKDHEINYNKIGRNEPCPCGSGKKFKKCCLNKVHKLLPYQKYIDETLEHYPKETNDDLNFYSYYDKENIEIDKLLYNGIKRKQIPMFIKRDEDKELDIDYEYLDKAYPLIKNIISKNNIKTIDDYDEKISIHYSIFSFFDKYSYCLIIKYIRGHKEYLDKLEELIKYFYTTFDIKDSEESMFLERIKDYCKVSKQYEDGIKFLEKRLTNKCYQYDIYTYLFELYYKFYDYNEATKKMEDLIFKEKDEEMKEYLEELKMEY